MIYLYIFIYIFQLKIQKHLLIFLVNVNSNIYHTLLKPKVFSDYLMDLSNNTNYQGTVVFFY